MEINRNNYEIFFMDYLDGKLRGKEIDLFLDFIEQNPDLKEELKGVKDLLLAPGEEITFDHKKSLYKTEKQKTEIKDYTAVAYMEGDLSKLETELFLKHLEYHPEQAKELELLMKTRLQADESIVFPKKNKLYRRTVSSQIMFWGTRIAAILVIAFAFWTIFNLRNEEKIINPTGPIVQNNKLAESNNEPVITEKPEITEAETLELVVKPSEQEKEQADIIKKENPEAEIITKERVPEIIEPLHSIPARLKSVGSNEKILLAGIQPKESTDSEAHSIESYLAEKVLGIKKSDNKSLLESGLDLASNLSKNRLSYETGDGKVSKINFDTRVLAFSIPVKNK